MSRSEALKRAQKKYMEAHPRKRIPVDVLPEDFELLKEVAADAGVPPITYIKQAVSEKSGKQFSWDKKQSPSEETE